MDQDKLQVLLDKQEIEDLCKCYMRGLDRLDHALLRSVYHDDATDHRGFFTGGPDEFCNLAITMLGEHHANHHMLGQMHIDVEGDVAFGEIYFQAFHRTVEHGLERDFFVWGRYVDRYERRGGVWKIAHRTELNDACRTDPANDIWLKETPEALRGYRGAEDLSAHREKLRTL
ncbi:MAG: nuclear transport factor 2 family protein [Pseudomonadota bacterium]